MTPENFVYWLQGFFEISNCDLNKKNMAETLSIQQVQTIKDHLKLVFEKQTPDRTVVIGSTIEEILKNVPNHESHVPLHPYTPDNVGRASSGTKLKDPYKREYC